MENIRNFINLKTIEEIKKIFSPYTNRVYLVGGFVRDMILKQPLKDLDFEIFDIDEIKFKSIMKKIGAVGAGESFFVYKYLDCDISLPRTEIKTTEGHKGFEVRICNDLKIASKRRDFTMNALMYNIFDETLEDFWGGVEDIKNKTIRIIDEKTFKEDSLRVLRAMQFSSRFAFRIEPKSIKIMQNISLNDLTKERIFMEFEKMFNSPNLHYGLFYLLKLKIGKKLFDMQFNQKKFIQKALELQRNKNKFVSEFYQFYFIYIVYPDMIKGLKTPNRYIKMLKKQFFHKNIDDKTLYLISLKYPIKEWLGNYQNDVIIRAKKFGIFEKKFNKIKPQDVIKDGFKGKNIGIELEKRLKDEIDILI